MPRRKINTVPIERVSQDSPTGSVRRANGRGSAADLAALGQRGGDRASVGVDVHRPLCRRGINRRPQRRLRQLGARHSCTASVGKRRVLYRSSSSAAAVGRPVFRRVIRSTIRPDRLRGSTAEGPGRGTVWTGSHPGGVVRVGPASVACGALSCRDRPGQPGAGGVAGGGGEGSAVVLGAVAQVGQAAAAGGLAEAGAVVADVEGEPLGVGCEIDIGGVGVGVGVAGDVGQGLEEHGRQAEWLARPR